MMSMNVTNVFSTKNATDIDHGDWKSICGSTLALLSEQITIAIVSNAKSRTMETTAMITHCNAVKGVGVHPIEGVISRGGESPCGWSLCPPLLLSMIRRIAILRMEGSLLTRGGSLSLMMVLLGIEEE